jgi:hypothetical protein
MAVAELKRESIMSAQGSTAAKKLFGVELPEPIAKLARKVTDMAGKPIVEDRLDVADVSPLVGYFDDRGAPHIAASKGHEPRLEEIALELTRLDFRKGRFEKNMPYAEMKHEANRRLCRRLYRIIEEEVILAESESLGVQVRALLTARLGKSFVEPLRSGSYRAGDEPPSRIREGALDALELTVAENDSKAAERRILEVADLDMDMARPLGMLYKVIENHRPFEADDRVRAAYYLAVPFLFDARRSQGQGRR